MAGLVPPARGRAHFAVHSEPLQRAKARPSTSLLPSRSRGCPAWGRAWRSLPNGLRY